MRTGITWSGNADEWLKSYWMIGMEGMERIAINQVAPRLKQYMQDNAPWIDRTGNARKFLNAKYDRTSPATFNITLSHGETIDYGSALEYGFSGRYSILRPTLQSQFPVVADEIFEAWR